MSIHPSICVYLLMCIYVYLIYVSMCLSVYASCMPASSSEVPNLLLFQTFLFRMMALFEKEHLLAYISRPHQQEIQATTLGQTTTLNKLKQYQNSS